MSTFFSTSFKPQPHIRQEGFHLDSDLGATGENHEGGHNSPPPFDFGRSNVMDFTDELASLMGAASPHPGSGGHHHHHQHHPHDGLSHGSHHEGSLQNHYHHQQQQQQQHHQSHERSTQSPVEDVSVSGSYRTHNIFDMGVGGPSAPPAHFNSTVLPLNSSMRYENPNPTSHDYHQNNTPSPPLGGAKERSGSRPPTSGSTTGGVGPQRTARTRRNNSISSTSPPPHIRPAAQAIVIPGVRHTNGGSLASPISSSATSVNHPWALASSSPASEFTLPTPDSLHHHSHSHLSSSVGFGGYFGSSDFGAYGPGTGGHGQHNGGHTPSTSLPTGGLHSHSHAHAHQRTNSAAASTTAGSTTSGTTGAANANANTNTAGLTTQEKQQLAVSEKRRRRRESHNAVERRRRDNINEKISELATLIPESLLEGGTLPGGGGAGGGATTNTTSGESPPGAVDLLSPTSPVGDSGEMWGAGSLIPMKREDALDSNLPLDSPVMAPNTNASSGASNTSAANGNNNNNNAGVVKANKGMILRKSVEYIRYLQQVVQEQDSRNRQLEMELRGYKERNGEVLSPILSTPASAFEFQANGNLNGSSAYAGAGYGGSFRMLESMPEDDAEVHNHHSLHHHQQLSQKSVNKSRESTPLTEDEQPDEDDPNDPDVEPPASVKKAAAAAAGGVTKRTTRGRKAAEAGMKARRSNKQDQDVDMGASDGEAMDV